MHRPALLLTALVLPLMAIGQELLTDAEMTDPEAEAEEIRRYTVELIVFAYAEDVSVGTELFIPEVVEIEPEPLPEDLGFDADGLPLEGPIPDDSVPTRVDEEPPAESTDETADDAILKPASDDLGVKNSARQHGRCVPQRRRIVILPENDMTFPDFHIPPRGTTRLGRRRRTNPDK